MDSKSSSCCSGSRLHCLASHSRLILPFSPSESAGATFVSRITCHSVTLSLPRTPISASAALRTISTHIAPRPIPATSTSDSFGSANTPILSFHGRCAPGGTSPSHSGTSSSTAVPRPVLTRSRATCPIPPHTCADRAAPKAPTRRTKGHARSSSTASAAAVFGERMRGRRGRSTRTKRHVDCLTMLVVCVSGSAVGPSAKAGASNGPVPRRRCPNDSVGVAQAPTRCSG
ncbi:hypothetical protein V8E53_007991 [Lactarius tabidus]